MYYTPDTCTAARGGHQPHPQPRRLLAHPCGPARRLPRPAVVEGGVRVLCLLQCHVRESSLPCWPPCARAHRIPAWQSSTAYLAGCNTET